MAQSQSHPQPAGGGSSARSVFVTLDGIVWRIERFFAFISSVFIFGLMVVGVVQIVSRKFFNAPIFGYIDIVELAMTTFAFLAISYTERVGGHVRMELVLGNLKGRVLWALELAGVLIAMFVVAVLIYYGWTHGIRAYESGDSTIDAAYPWWPSKMMVPLAFSLLWLRLLLMAWGYGRMLADPDRRPEGVPVTADVRRQAELEAEEAATARRDEHNAEGR